jgi:hypothetical protein
MRNMMMEQTKVKAEKKMIFLCILALTIGIATMLPLVYFTGSNNMTAAGQSWFNVDIPYAYIDLYYTGKTGRAYWWDGASIDAAVNFTLTPEALKLNGADAQIEFYMFHVYSEQGSIVNMSYSVAVSRGTKWVPNEPLKEVGITGSGNNYYYFADGTMFDGNTILGDNHQCCGAITQYVTPGEPDDLSVRGYIYSSLSTFIGDSGDPYEEKSMEALAALRSAQVVYIEVSRVCSVSYTADPQQEISSTRVTLVDGEVLGYVELTRVDEGFICGEYIEGSLPWPVRGPASMLVLLPLSLVYKLKLFLSICDLQLVCFLKVMPCLGC